MTLAKKNMNPTLKIISIFVLLHVGSTQAEESKTRTITRAPNVSLDFSDHLYKEAKWQLGDESNLTLKMDGDSTVFLHDDKKEVFRLNAPEYISETVSSEDGKSVVFAVNASLGSGSNYSTLVLVSYEARGIKAAKVLKTGQKLFGGRRWWVSELGAVTNDGTRVLAKFGVMSPPKNGMSKVVYSWYTVESSTGEILSSGLTIENSKTPSKQ